MARAVPTLHGRALGVELARLADSQVAANPEIEERCLTCAFREGTMTNSMAPTLMEAVNCVVGIDEADFGCHHGLAADGQPTKLCAGYLLCMAAPAEERFSAVERASIALRSLNDGDDEKHDPEFTAWVKQHDPEGKLDDYQLARAWARRV